jgi:hypothetical protein
VVLGGSSRFPDFEQPGWDMLERYKTQHIQLLFMYAATRFSYATNEENCCVLFKDIVRQLVGAACTRLRNGGGAAFSPTSKGRAMNTLPTLSYNPKPLNGRKAATQASLQVASTYWAAYTRWDPPFCDPFCLVKDVLA